MNWMILPLKRYADFQGRSRPKEYWLFLLGLLIFYAVLGALAVATGVFERRNDGSIPAAPIILMLVFVIVALGLIIPSIAVQVRRFHDQDKTGWLVLISFIPYIGGLIVLVMMCLPGTRGPNRYGPDPLDPDGVRELSDVFG